MDVADKEHMENLNKMEYKFLKEKVLSLKESPKKLLITLIHMGVNGK